MSNAQFWYSLEDMVFAVAMFLTAFGLVAITQFYRYRKNRDLQATIRAAIEKGQELPVEVLEALNQPRKKPEPQKDRDLRRGIVLMAVGLGVGTFGYLIGEEEVVGPLMGIGSIPLLIGLGLTLLWILRTRHEH